MKLQYIDEDHFKVFLIKNQKNSVDYENKAELKEFLKDILLGIKKNYHFQIYGFYEVKILVLGVLGYCLEFERIEEDLFSSKTIDLKIVILLNSKVYLAFDDYEVVANYRPLYFWKNQYLISLEDLKEEDLYVLSEWYSLFFDEEEKIGKMHLLYS